MKNIQNTQDFIEQFYPNYSRCNEIAENNDLLKILEGQIEGAAENLYYEIKKEKAVYFGQTLDEEELKSEVIKEVQQLYDSSIALIYEIAIEGFIENQKL